MNEHAVLPEQLAQREHVPLADLEGVLGVDAAGEGANGNHKWVHVQGKWIANMQLCRVGYFALMQAEDTTTSVVSIELVKITQAPTFESNRKFLGTVYLCTHVQTTAVCLDKIWHVSKKRNYE